MKPIDLLRTSSQSLARNRSRSGLTILGIVIGIASVILMLSIGRGAEGLILNQVADLGSDLVFVEPSSGDPAAGPPDPFVEQTLDLDDYTAIKNSGLFTAVDATLYSTVPVTYQQRSTFSQIAGVTEDYLDIFPADLQAGNFLSASDVETSARVAVLGKEVAEDLFGDQNPIGRRIRIKNSAFRVIGVFDEQGTRFFQNLDTQIAVPVTAAQRDILGVDYVSFISARADGDIELAKEELRFLMRDLHDIDNPEGVQEKDDFFVSSQSDAVEIISVVGNVLTLLLASIAAISLVVGGIGIMNIMLVSVTERTKEIGLRKSVGATKNDILKQFLLEAILLTLVGGVLGVFIGVGLSVLGGFVAGRYVDGWTTTIPISAIILGVLVATTVGVVFGIYPAQRAAKLEPVEALRYE